MNNLLKSILIALGAWVVLFAVVAIGVLLWTLNPAIVIVVGMFAISVIIVYLLLTEDRF